MTSEREHVLSVIYSVSILYKLVFMAVFYAGFQSQLLADLVHYSGLCDLLLSIMVIGIFFFNVKRKTKIVSVVLSVVNILTISLYDILYMRLWSFKG